MRNARHFCWILAGLLAACSKNDSSDDENNGNWKLMPEMSGKPRSEAVAFTIGDTAYIGTGFGDQDKYLRDFWKFNPEYGWGQVAELPAAAAGRSNATAFVANGIAYVGTGFDGLNRLNDFWAYNPATGGWTKKASLISPNPAVDLSRKDAVSFSLNGKGFVATGYDGGALKDVWEYNPATDSWAAKRSFGGDKRTDAVAFVIGDKAYIVTGANNGEFKTDLWVYNAATDEWTTKRRITNYNEDEDYDNDYDVVRSNAVAFVMNNKAYVTTGSKSGLAADCWEYDPITDLWDKKRDFEGVARTGAAAFTLGGKGYVLSGRTSSLLLDNMFVFDPTATYNKND